MTAAEPGPGHPRRHRRRRAAVLVPVVLALVVTGGLVAFTRLGTARTARPAAQPPAPATAEVTRGDLVQHFTADATVGYGRSSDVFGRGQGTLTWLPAAGTVVGRGERLYAVDAVGVPLLFGDTPTFRTLALGVPDGPDVVMLQQNLVALGFAEAGPANGKFTATTARALRRWQKRLKRVETGTLQASDVVVLPGAVRVDSVSAQLGTPADGKLMKVTGTDRVVTAELEPAQRPLAAAGAKVVVTLADRRRTPGTVRTVAVADREQQDDAKKPKLAVTITLDDPGVAAAVEAGPVTVRFDGEVRKGVLSVPVEALLALREGGYAVEVLDDAGRRLVAVEVGLFAEGRVEVSGEGLREGLRVVTAA